MSRLNNCRRLLAGGRNLATVLLVAGVLGACGNSSEEPEYVERPVEDLYNAAMDEMMAANYPESSRLFDEVEIQFHPGNPSVDYAYYLKAVSYYEQISDVGRDQKMTREALGALDEVMRRYPNSKYARDATLKVDLARDHLAGKHMDIGRYYQNQGEYLGAINRFRIVIRDYQTTTHVPEALHRLVECYLSLGVVDEAQATAAVLGYNYPGSEWYVDSYALLTGVDLTPEDQKDSWIASVWKSVF
jgi:outer membrane protein assembly factor BamD